MNSKRNNQQRHIPLFLFLPLICCTANSTSKDLGVVDAGSRPDSSAIDADFSKDKMSVPDLSIPISCGSHTIVQGNCKSRCPSPCVCVTFLDPEISGQLPFDLCATPCSVPGTCPIDERCSFLVNKKSTTQPVCLPGTLKTPPFQPHGFLDCFPDEHTSMPKCYNGYLVQSQLFWVTGGLSGSICANVFLEDCVGGCKPPDAGTTECKSKTDSRILSSDAGTPICCSNFSGACFPKGGPKRPPHGCRVSCCSLCTWKKGIELGCTTWTPVKIDAGPDSAGK